MGIHLAPAGPPSASSVAHPGSRRGGFGDAIETSAENSRTPPREVQPGGAHVGRSGGSGCAEPGVPAERTRRRGGALPRAEPSPRRPASPARRRIGCRLTSAATRSGQRVLRRRRGRPRPSAAAPKEILKALGPARRLGEDGERATDREAQARTRRIWPARACGVAPPRRRASTAGAQGRERAGRAAPVCQQLWGRDGI